MLGSMDSEDLPPEFRRWLKSQPEDDSGERLRRNMPTVEYVPTKSRGQTYLQPGARQQKSKAEKAKEKTNTQATAGGFNLHKLYTVMLCFKHKFIVLSFTFAVPQSFLLLGTGEGKEAKLSVLQCCYFCSWYS